MSIDKRERERRLNLVHAHMAAENAHDIEAIMATFAPTTEMVFNGQRFEEHDQIRGAHISFGMSAIPMGLEDLRLETDRESISDDYVLIEARLFARHSRPVFGYPPSNTAVELYYTAAYRFDPSGKLASERVVMNLGPISLPYALLVNPAQPAP